MADIFDNIFNEAELELGVSPSAPSVFTPKKSDALGLRNAAVRGIGNALDFAGELVPEIDLVDKTVRAPRLFGLSKYFGFEESTPSSSILRPYLRQKGMFDDTQAESELGQLASDTVEQGLSAGLFGPTAILGSAITSGPGAYIGRKIGGDTGATIGSVFSPFMVSGIRAGANKLRQLNSSTQSVGNLLQDSIEPAAKERLLRGQLSKIGTTAEQVDSAKLAGLEDVAQSAQIGDLGEAAADRRFARIFDVNEMLPVDRSDLVESGLKQSLGNIEKSEKAAWDLVPKQAELIGDHLNGALAQKIDNATLGGSVPLTGTAKGLIERWKNLTSNTFTIEELQAFRSRVLEEGRALKGATGEEATITKKIIKILDKHADDILDDNAAAGIVRGEAADLLKSARGKTKAKYETFAPESESASKATESILEGESLFDAKTLQEGLRSRDAMAAQINAAAKGGVDIRPVYQDAIKQTLNGMDQGRWPDYIKKNRAQIEMAFGDDIDAIDGMLVDLLSETKKAKNVKSVFGGQSATFSRGELGKKLDRARPFAELPKWASRGGGTLAGWEAGGALVDRDDTFAEQALKRLGGAGAGLFLGRQAEVFANPMLARMRNSFDTELSNALRNPSVAREALLSVQKSPLDQFVGSSFSGAMKASPGRYYSERNMPPELQLPGNVIVEDYGQQEFDPVFNDIFSDQPIVEDDMKLTPQPDTDVSPQPNRKYKVDSALKNVLFKHESNNNPKAESQENEYMKAKKTGTAKGLGQLLDDTGKELFGRYKDILPASASPEKYDPFNETQNEILATNYLEELLDKYDGDLELALTAYHSGMGTVDKLLRKTKGSTLSDILPHLGKVGKSYARSIIENYKKQLSVNI